MDDFFTKEYCDRCHNPIGDIRKMSMYNTDCLCEACIKAEQKRSDYKLAQDADIEAIRNGNYNFPALATRRMKLIEMDNELFCTMKGFSKITEINGKSNAEFLKDAELGDIICFSMSLKKSLFCAKVSENVICCTNLRTNKESVMTPNQINRVIAKFTLEQIYIDVMHSPKNNDLTNITIESMDFSVRTYNCTKRAGVNTLADLASKTKDDLMRVRNLGRNGMSEVIEKCKMHGVIIENETMI